jgi:RNA polymerase primary sigma factor
LALEEAIEKHRLREKLGTREVKLLDRFLMEGSLEEEELEELSKALQEAMSKAAAA